MEFELPFCSRQPDEHNGSCLNPAASRRPVDRNHSPSTRRRCSLRISSAMLVRDNRTSSANGAFGRHERHESEGMRLVTAASG